MITRVRIVVAGAAESRDARHLKRVVEACYSGDIDRGGVEHPLAPSNRPAIRGNALVVALRVLQALPHRRRVEIENIGIEWCASGIQADGIVDSDEELGELPRQREGAAVRSVGVQIVRLVVENLSRKDTGLELDDLLLLARRRRLL